MILKFKIGGIWVDILPKIKFHSKESIENWNCKQLKNTLGKACMRQGQMSTYFGFYREVV